MLYDINHPKTVAKWLRRCVEDAQEADRCYSCPYGLYSSLDDEKNCIDELHHAAAELIERQSGIQRKERG